MSQGLACPGEHFFPLLQPIPHTGTRTLMHTQAGAHTGLALPRGGVLPRQNRVSPGRIEQNLHSGLPEPSSEGSTPPGRGGSVPIAVLRPWASS